MANGYTGKILRVDLSDGSMWTEEHDDAFYRRYFGGRALVAYYLLSETKPGADPLGPDNLLILAPGVVTGTSVSGNGRNGVGALSPLTGGFGNAEAGGFWGAELKRSGFDAIVVRGKAAKPTYLWIKEGVAELRDASHLWGKTTGETEEILFKDHNDRNLKTCLIGQGGENLVRVASIINDRNRSAGRTGLGAVMGSKMLKGIAVKARGQLPTADPKSILAIQKWMTKNLDLTSLLHDTGTAGHLRSLSAAGGLPTYNFQEGTFAGDDKISGQTMRDTILVKRETCYACAVRCKRVVEVKDDYQVDPAYGGPEYESLSAMGNLNGVDNLHALAKANEMCAAYGMDTIGVGAVIAWALECAEKGLITEEDTDGLKLEWGNAKLLLQLVDMIAHREGFGDVLADGAVRASHRIGRGSEQYVLAVKGQEYPMHEPRIKHALGIGYAVSPTGADHMHNMHDTIMATKGWAYDAMKESYGEGRDWETINHHGLDTEKMELWYAFTHWRHFLDSAGMCHFLPYSPSQLVQLVNGATGWNTTEEELLEVGELSDTLARAVNYREGYSGDHDHLHKRIHGRFRNDASSTGKPMDPEETAGAIKWVYERSGWDGDGAPKKDILDKFGVSWVYEAMQPTPETIESKREMVTAG